MLQRHFFHGFIVLLASLWLAGCASPHYLQLNPQRSASVPQVGQGQEVTVIAQDGRDSDIIGNRTGTGMSSAHITVSSHELIPHLQKEAERAVRDMGFTPTQEPAEGRPKLVLVLDNLAYARADGGQALIDEARLEAVFRAEASHQGTTYVGTYTSRRTQGYAFKPSRDSNTRMLNDLLSDGLDRAFSDPELAGLLAR